MRATQTLRTQIKIKETMKMLKITLVVIFGSCPLYLPLYGICLNIITANNHLCIA